MGPVSKHWDCWQALGLHHTPSSHATATTAAAAVVHARVLLLYSRWRSPWAWHSQWQLPALPFALLARGRRRLAKQVPIPACLGALRPEGTPRPAVATALLRAAEKLRRYSTQEGRHCAPPTGCPA